MIRQGGRQHTRIRTVRRAGHNPVHQRDKMFKNQADPDDAAKVKQKVPHGGAFGGFAGAYGGRLAVMVVPMFSPSTSAQEVSKLIMPAAAQVSVMAMTALEDCKIIVSMVPVAISKISVAAVSGVNLDSHSTTNGPLGKVRRNGVFHNVQPQEQKPETQQAFGRAAHGHPFGGQELEEKAYGDYRQGKKRNLDFKPEHADDPRRHGRADVGAENYAQRLIKVQQPRAGKAHHHNGGSRWRTE